MAPLAEVYWTDARLVKQVLAEDPRAFERLISRHQKRACAIARATGVRPDDLEDVVQESFVRAFEKLAQLRAPGFFPTAFSLPKRMNIPRRASLSSNLLANERLNRAMNRTDWRV